MEFYGQRYSDIMALPIKAFWLMNDNINRIQAQKDMRTLSMTVAGHAAGEAAQDLRQRLIVEAGTVVKVSGEPIGRPYVHEQRDEAGFAELKELSRMF